MASILVTTASDVTNDRDGLTSLREAIDLAGAMPGRDEITFDAGLLGDNGAVTLRLLKGEQSIGSDLSIAGDVDGDGIGDVTVDARGESRAFLITAGTVDLDDMTISRGSSSGSGGGLHVSEGAVLNLSGVTVSDNTTNTNGGGLFNLGTLTLTDTAVTGNAALSNSGGLHNEGELTLIRSAITKNSAIVNAGGMQNNGTAILTASTVADNLAFGNGGGLFNNGTGRLTLDLSTISGNSAGGNAGGLFNTGTALLSGTEVTGNSAGRLGGGVSNTGTLTLVSSTVAMNDADRLGGGLFNGGTATLDNTTLSTNTAGANGGGLFTSGEVTLNSSTVSGNVATFNGGGLAVADSATATLANSIVVGNTGRGAGREISGAFKTANADNITSGETVDVFAQTGTNGGGLLADNGGPVRTIALKPTGPAVDGGNGAARSADIADLDGDSDRAEALPLDARGEARIAGAEIDLGAFEHRPTIVVDTVQDVVNADDGRISLREAVAMANAGPGTDSIAFAARLLGSDGKADLALDSGALVLGAGISISGDVDGDGIGDVTLNAQGLSRVFDITAGTTRLEGLTITQGRSDSGSGGAIRVGADAALDLVNATVSRSVAAGDGGGLDIAGRTTLVNVTLSDNSASGTGGGLSSSSALALVNTTLANNSAADDGGGLFSSGEVTLDAVTVSGNSSRGDGGGLAIGSGEARLTNSIVLGNSANGRGDEVSGDVTETGENLTSGDPAAIFAQIGTGGGGRLADNGGPVQTIALDPGGAAIDAGDADALPADTMDLDGDGDTRELLPFDALGTERVAGDGLDLGAAEYGFGAGTLPDSAIVAEDAASGLDLAGFSLYSSNSASALTLEITAEKGTLRASSGDGVSVSGSGSGRMVLTGTASALNAFIVAQDFTYTGPVDVAGLEADRLQLRLDDAAGSGEIDLGGIDIDIAPTPDAPTALKLAGASVAENAAGHEVGEITVSDPDVSDRFEFALSDRRFEVVDGILKLKDGRSLDYEREKELTLKVTATDTDGLSISKSFEIEVLDTADLVGTGRDDKMRGNGNDNEMAGRGGDDLIRGFGGNDDLSGQNGDDRLLGDRGRDQLHGGRGEDQLDGGGGRDRLFGDGGDDQLLGGAGHDRLFGNKGADRLAGEQGDDRLFGNGGRDWLLGGAGDDRLFGNSANDRLVGGAGEDRLFGQGGHDRLVGGAGADHLDGGAGRDMLYGRSGDDVFVFSAGNDRMFGGRGFDTVEMGDAVAAFELRLGNKVVITQDETRSVLRDMERLEFDDAIYERGDDGWAVIA